MRPMTSDTQKALELIIPIAAAIADMLGIDWKEVVELCKPIEEE